MKRPLSDIIFCKLLNCIKNIKFIKIDGFQDIKMQVRNFQKESIEFLYDHGFLAKLFWSSLQDDILKWHFTLLEKSINKYEDLILEFIGNFKYKIKDKTQFKDLCRIK